VNITGAVVIDPREIGELCDPYLLLTVDEEVQEIDDTIFDEDLVWDHRLIPCGPFYAVEKRMTGRRPGEGGHWADLAELTRADEVTSLGVVNKSELIDYQIVQVSVSHIPEEDNEDRTRELLEMAMYVTRARRTIRRKTDNRYEVIVDEQAALGGLLAWRLELREKVCYSGAMIGRANHTCTLPVVSTVMIQDTHVTLCEKHKDVYENRARSARARKNK